MKNVFKYLAKIEKDTSTEYTKKCNNIKFDRKIANTILFVYYIKYIKFYYNFCLFVDGILLISKVLDKL